MISWTVKYTGFDGKPATEELWFHISQRQLIRWMLIEKDEMLPSNLVKLAESGDAKKIIDLFEKIILTGYGTRPANGDVNRFHRDDVQTQDFMDSPAYDALFTALMYDEKKAAEFFSAMFPPDLMAQAQAAMEAGVVPTGVVVPAEKVKETETKELQLDVVKRRSGLANPLGKDGQPLAWAFRDPNDAELSKMTAAQMRECMKRKMTGWLPLAPS